MFSENQTAILRLLARDPSAVHSMSDVGRALGKHPGVFQRGLNALVKTGYILDHQDGRCRRLRINTEHPLHAAIRQIAGADASPLPPEFYLTHRLTPDERPSRVEEPPGVYDVATRKLLIIAGPNGAGKSTFARQYLPGEAHCPTFINADYLALGLSPFAPEQAAMKAGRLMLKELDRHIANGQSVAIETTLSGLRYARRIPAWQQSGYAVKVIFLSLPSVEMAIARVATRVCQGGHAIPVATIRRRFESGRRNFEQIYKPLSDAWALYDSAGPTPLLIEEHER